MTPRYLFEILGVAAFGGSAVYLWLESLGIERSTAAVAGMIVVALIRFGAIRWDLRLPSPRVPNTGEHEQPPV